MKPSPAVLQIAERISSAIKKSEYGQLDLTIKWSGNRNVLIRLSRSEDVQLSRSEFRPESENEYNQQ